MKDNYVYPAIFDYADDGISISFPDVPGCFSCADSDEEAIRMAREALGLHLYSLETDGDPIPEATHLPDVALEPNQKAVLVDVYMPVIRASVVTVPVKKTLTIPAWLDAAAKQHNVNFSQVLQEALKERLGVSNHVV
jgi:predicted RNase H-like HicB family nuclease